MWWWFHDWQAEGRDSGVQAEGIQGGKVVETEKVLNGEICAVQDHS